MQSLLAFGVIVYALIDRPTPTPVEERTGGADLEFERGWISARLYPRTEAGRSFLDSYRRRVTPHPYRLNIPRAFLPELLKGAAAAGLSVGRHESERGRS